MPKLAAISHRDLVARLRHFGFEGPFAGGKHLYMVRSEVRLTLPNPHRASIGVGLLAKILRQAGISREEWLRRP